MFLFTFSFHSNSCLVCMIFCIDKVTVSIFVFAIAVLPLFTTLMDSTLIKISYVLYFTFTFILFEFSVLRKIAPYLKFPQINPRRPAHPIIR